MMSSGHTVAMLSGMAQFSESSYYSNKMRGYGFYQLIQKIDTEFEQLKNEIIKNLEKLVELIFTKENMIVSFTADEEGYQLFEKPMTAFVEELKNESCEMAQRKFTPEHIKTAFTSSSQVQYVARCGNYRKGGFDYTGALRLLKVIFSYDYLWIKVRVQGGAYGCMSGFYRNGDMYFASYRDPNLGKTIEIYEGAASYLQNFNVSDRDMLKFIIGTIGNMDTPMNPASKGTRSFAAYICHTTYEDLRKERNEVLHANVDSIRALAPLIACGVDQNYLGVVGNQKMIQNEAGLFDKIQPLYM